MAGAREKEGGQLEIVAIQTTLIYIMMLHFDALSKPRLHFRLASFLLINNENEFAEAIPAVSMQWKSDDFAGLIRACESGGIGRRARFRIWCLRTWGFKSPLSHYW